MHSISNIFAKAFSTLLISFIFSTGINLVNAQEGTDKGYFFIGPEIETSGKEFKDGKYLKHYTHEGVVISENLPVPGMKVYSMSRDLP
jgi:hypothetical protein